MDENAKLIAVLRQENLLLRSVVRLLRETIKDVMQLTKMEDNYPRSHETLQEILSKTDNV